MTESFDSFPTQSKPPTANEADDNISKNKLIKSSSSSCNCWVCEELKDRKKIVQRQNFLLPVTIGFEHN